MEGIIKKLRGKYSKTRQRSIVRNFYSKEVNKGKTYRAAYLDNVLFMLFIFFILVIILIIKSNSILLPIYIGLISIFFITKGINSINQKKNKKKILAINEDLKSRRVIRELTQLNREEFIEYTKEILDKFYSTEFIIGEDGIDLVGYINKKKYGVKCIKSSLEDRILSKKVDEFSNLINSQDYDEGILVTNSYFQDGIKDNTSLILIDFLGIKEILKKIEKFPSDEEIRNYIIHRYDDRKNAIRNQIKVITFGKILKLYGVFIVFYFISFFVKYGLYYKIMGVIAFVIATILGGIRFTEYYNKVKDLPRFDRR